MKKVNFSGFRYAAVIVMFFSIAFRGESQRTLPDELLKSTLKDQMDYIQEKTKIYEDYRAIREDMFQQIKRNSLDSLNSARLEINSLKKTADSRSLFIDSLKTSLESTGRQLEEMTSTKNSISLLGLKINKGTYNTIMWLFIAIMAGVIVFGFLAFKRNRIVTLHTKRDYEDLRKEFDAYRKASREAREKMSMAHFNEMKKIRTV